MEDMQNYPWEDEIAKLEDELLDPPEYPSQRVTEQMVAQKIVENQRRQVKLTSTEIEFWCVLGGGIQPQELAQLRAL